MPGARDRHDRLFKRTFNDLRNLEVELRAVLPSRLVQRLDFSTLRREPVDFYVPGMAPIQGDLLVSAQLEEQQVFFWILTEHQSTVDELMPLRFYGYCYAAWSEVVTNRRSQKLPLLPLPVIIPVLVHHSETGWTAARTFQDLFDQRLIACPEVARYLPNFEFILDDLSQLSSEEILARARQQTEAAAALVLLALRFGRDRQEFYGQLARLSEFILLVLSTPAGVDAFRSVLDYLDKPKREDHIQVLDELRRAMGPASPEARKAVMSIAEELRIEGRVEGRVEGERLLLRRLLTLKFGPLPQTVSAVLDVATEQQLETWAERVLTAASLEEVLA